MGSGDSHAKAAGFNIVEVGTSQRMFEKKRKLEVHRSQSEISAHEAHNLIAVIIAEAQLLQLEFPRDNPNHLSAVAIERAGRRLETLIDRLAAADTPQTQESMRPETPVHAAEQGQEIQIAES